jgi:5S rRNA maturation endonuclease (ribonuclease M5)
VLYRLGEVREGITSDRWVFVVEGEKDADRLSALGVVATCNPGGAGKWRAGYSEMLRGARVAVLPDNDESGRRHARQVAESLAGVAQDVRSSSCRVYLIVATYRNGSQRVALSSSSRLSFAIRRRRTVAAVIRLTRSLPGSTE